MLQGSAEQGKKGLLLYWKYLALKKITHTHYLLVAKLDFYAVSYLLIDFLFMNA